VKKDRRSYEILQKVLKVIKENSLITEGSHVIVGLSGGTDSVCLFRLLLELRDEIAFTMSAIHIHHGIREITADRDAQFVKDICEQESIPVTVIYEDIPGIVEKSGESIEECARRVRYEYFAKELLNYENGVIAVAHHIDDQAETVLFRMIRGTGVKGLKAMRVRNGSIIRPLLGLTREEITEYLSINEYKYCVDETNEDTLYSRNGIRHLVMPELNKICSQASSHIAELADEAAKIDEYLDSKAHELYEKSILEDDGKVKTFSVSVLSEDAEVIKSRAIRIIIENIIHSLKDVTRDHVDAVLSLLNKEKSSSLDLPKGISVLKEGDLLIFTVGDKDKNENNKLYIEINGPGRYIIDENRVLDMEIESVSEGFSPPRNLYTKWIDCDKINPDLCIRTRQEGDYLVADLKGSRKSISRYMIDEKIPKSKRDDILLLASGSEVYWVIGYRISESVKITDETVKVVKITIKEIEEQ